MTKFTDFFGLNRIFYLVNPPKLLRFFVALFFIFGIGCSPSSPKEFQSEADAICREMAKDLRKVKTREELVDLLPKLKKNYLKLAYLIESARGYHQKHPGAFILENNKPSSLELYLEIQRMYLLPGGREILEEAQKDALQHLEK